MPEVPLDLPAYVPRPDERLWRVYRTRDPKTGASWSPWFFASSDDPARSKVPGLADPSGRFDLPLPEGTLYAADTPEAAYREHFQALLVTPDTERGRALAWLSADVAGSVRIGDLAHPQAEFAGVTLREAEVPDRAETQRVARRVRAAGFDGIRALRRSDPSGSTHTVGLFGPAGAHSSLPGWRTHRGLGLRRPQPPVPPPRTMPLAPPP